MTEVSLDRTRTFAKHSLVYVAGEFASKGIAFALIPLYVAYLSPEDYGIIETLRALLNLLMLVLTFGLPSAVIRFYYDYSSRNEYGRFLGSTVTFTLLGAGIICVVFDVFKEYLFAGLMPQVPLKPYINLVIWTAFFTVLGQTMTSHYRAKQKPGLAVTIDTGRAIFIAVGAVAFLALLNRGAVGKLQGDLCAYAFYTAVCAILFVRVAKPALSLSRIADALRFGLPLIPVSLALWIMGFVDRLILLQYRPISEVGVYSLGYNLAIILALISTAIARAWQPLLYESADKGIHNRVIPRLAYFYASAVCFVGLAIVVFSKQVISTIAPQSYQGAISVVPTVVLGYVLFSFSIVFPHQIGFAKKNLILAYIAIGCAALNIVLNLALIPWFGMHGAALATTITFAILCVLSYSAAQRIFYVAYAIGTILVLLVSFCALTLAFMLMGPTGFMFRTAFGLAILGLFLTLAFVLRLKAVRDSKPFDS